MTVFKLTQCPACGSDAAYQYGKAKNGKERRICLICNRQYIVERSRMAVTNRPSCPSCGEPMHVFRRQSGFTRYRCKHYPACRTYVKIPDEDDNITTRR